MEQYISKSAVLAEIDKVMAEEMKFYETACKEGDEEVSSSPMVYTRLQILRSCINTLEAKEVDLEKEIDFAMPSKYCWSGDGEAVYSKEQMRNFAIHFFELGLKVAQKGE